MASTAPRRRLLAGTLIAAGVLAAATLGLFLIKPATLAPSSSPSRAETPFDPIGAQKRILDGASLERVVSVLAENVTIKIGHDRLRFSVRASHAGHLYAQMVGTDRREFTLLFSNALDKNNHVEAGQSIHLPRPTWKMGASGPPGIDHFSLSCRMRRASFAAPAWSTTSCFRPSR